MDVVGFFTLVGFGPTGWGIPLLQATLMTLGVSACAFATGLILGALGAWAKISGGRAARGVADVYTTVLRGVPELLVIYLVYFGGSAVITRFGHALGEQGFLGLNGFLVGTVAVGVVSGAYQAETLRGGFLAVPPGELDAARAVGMGKLLMLWRIIAPRVLRFALPAMGNIWQAVLKDTSLISVTGLVEILRQVHIGAGSTRRPFEFYIAGMVLYLILTTLTGIVFRGAEQWTTRSERAA